MDLEPNSDPYLVKMRVYNNRLHEALKRTFPEAKSRIEQARCVGISHQILYSWLTMRVFPYSKKHKTYHKKAYFLAEVVGERVEYLFDPELYGIGPIELQRSVDFLPEAQIETNKPETKLLNAANSELITKAFKKLKGRYAGAERGISVLKMRFGLDGNGPMTLEDIGKELGLNRERVRQIEAKALRHLRHPSISRSLRGIIIE